MRSIKDRARDIPIHISRARSTTSKESWNSPCRKKITGPPTKINNSPIEINEPSIELAEPPTVLPEPPTETNAQNIAEIKLINGDSFKCPICKAEYKNI